jgi:hypothetical protein
MHNLHRPELTMKYLDDGIKIIVIKAQSGETVCCEMNDETAADWAARIAAPHPGGPSEMVEVG